MDEAERLMFEGWARLPRFKAKIDQANEIIREALEIAPAYVACSWGKDSVVLAHLCQQIQPDILIIHDGCELEYSQDSYRKVERDYCDRFQPNYRRLETDGSFKHWIEASKTHPMGVIGLRAQESSRRRIVLRKYGIIYQYTSRDRQDMMRACPLAWWSWQDVWAYTVAHNLPYLASYDNPASGSRAHSRTSVIHNPDDIHTHNLGPSRGALEIAKYYQFNHATN